MTAPPPADRPLSVPGLALAAAAVGLAELAWVHRTQGPFQTGSPWAGALVTLAVHAAVGALLALAARLAGRWLPGIGTAAATLPLALAVPLAAGLVETQLARWAPLPVRAGELLGAAAAAALGVALAALVLRRVPVLGPLFCSARLFGAVCALLVAWVGLQPQVARGDGPREAGDAPAGAASALLVTIDTLRADGVGAYGHAAARTPTLDGLAADGVLYETALTPSVLTGPSHMSILSGLLPMQHGVIENAVRLPSEVPTVAETLSEAGWDTAAFVSGFPVSEKASALLGRFDVWDDDMRADRRVPRLVWRLALGRLALRVLEPFDVQPLPRWRKAPRVSDAAVDWLEGGSAPFFAWVHYYDPHLPYEAPDELIPESARRFDGPRGEDWYHLSPDQRREVIEDERAVERMRALYDAEVALVDRELARVVAAARRRAGPAGLWVLVTADHGESFGEHGIYYRRELYDPSLRVPMILATPEGGPRGVRVSEQVRLTDVAPTLLEALGVERDLAGEGVSLLPLARGSKSTLPGPSISAIYPSNADPYQRFLLAVRNGRWKSIWRKQGWANSDALWAPEGRELYDLQADPGELNSLAADQPGVWESLRDMAGQVQVELRSDQEHSAGALEALRDLGYVH